MRVFRYYDALSINYYGEDPPVGYFNYVHLKTGKPILLSEFSFRARDTGHPNTRGAGVILNTQAERARYVEYWIPTLLEQGYFIGYLWWEYMDEPFDGRRPDAEDGNYGLVNLSDEPYVELINVFKGVNSLFPKVS